MDTSSFVSTLAHHNVRLWAIAVVLVLGCDGIFGPDRQRIRVLRVGEPTTGSVSAGDTTVYRVDAPTGQPLRLFLKAETHPLVAEVIDGVSGSDGVLRRLISTGGDTLLASGGTTWFEAPADRTLHVHVRGRTTSGGGGYTLLLFALDRGPEAGPARVAVGDTVADQSIGPPGDVDEFFFAGDSGQELIVFFESMSPTQLRLVVGDSALGGAAATVFASDGNGVLEERSTGRFVIPTSTTYELAVSGPSLRGHADAPYRFHIFPVVRAPESVPGSVELDDAIYGEAIEPVGDIDEFVLSNPVEQEINLTFRRIRGSGEIIRLELLGSDGQAWKSLSADKAGRTLNELGMGRFTLPAGDHTIRLSGQAWGDPARAAGEYAFEAYRIDRAPETHSARIAIGDTVVGEALDRPGDVDVFTFAGSEGQLVNAFVRSLEQDTAMSFRLEFPGYPNAAESRSDGAATGSTGRFTLLATGDYTVQVLGPGAESMDWGAYEFEIFPVDPEPETLAPTIALGDTVSGERIDRIGDMDRFTFPGEEGGEINLFGWAESDATGPFHLQIVDPSGARLDDSGMTTGDHSTWRLRFPTAGEYTVEVVGASAPDTSTGRYGFQVFPIDRAPEVVDSSIAVGDTIVGEAIQPVGDVDEFVFTAAAGDTLRMDVTIQMRSVYIQVFDLTTGERVTGGWISGLTTTRPYSFYFVIRARSTGAYRVTFDTGSWDGGGTDQQGPYSFALVPND